MVSHFHFHFPDDICCGVSFHNAYLTSEYLLGGGVCPGLQFMFESGLLLLLSFKSALCFVDNKAFISSVFGKGFLPNCGLSSNSLDIVFYRAEVFNLSQVQFVNFFIDCFFGFVSKKPSPYPRPSEFSRF